MQALELAGARLAAASKQALEPALAEQDPAKSLVAIQNAARSAVRGRRHDQSGKPREGGRRSGPEEARPTWLASVSGEGCQRGRRDGAVQVSSPNAAKLHKPSTGQADPPQSISPQDVSDAGSTYRSILRSRSTRNCRACRWNIA